MNTPALEPPPGIEPNFIDSPNHRSLFLGVMIACLVITVIATLIQFYVKIFLIRTIHYEDYALMAALLLQIGHYAPGLHATEFAPGLHQWDIPLRDIKQFLLDFHIGAIFYDMTILALKVSIMMQFLRIFVPNRDRSLTFWLTHIVLWTNTIFYIVIVFMEIFACTPIAKRWDPFITDGRCINTSLQYLTSASFNFALDFVMLVWTQKVIWSLHMSTNRKLRVGVVFIAGLLACIFGGIGLYLNVKLLQTEDQVYISSLMAMYTFPETTSGFLVLCLPCFPRFFNAMMIKVFPQAPGFLARTKARILAQEGVPPQANLIQERKGSVKGAKRSLWHISADPEDSQLTTERTERTGDEANSAKGV